MCDDVTCSKFTKPRLCHVFSNFRCSRVVFTWVFFPLWLLCELEHENIYISHYQSEPVDGDFCQADVITHIRAINFPVLDIAKCYLHNAVNWTKFRFCEVFFLFNFKFGPLADNPVKVSVDIVLNSSTRLFSAGKKNFSQMLIVCLFVDHY